MSLIRCGLTIAGIVALGICPSWICGQDIEQQLQDQYKVSQVATDGRVAKVGTILTVQLEGIKAIPSSYEKYFANTMKDGRIKPNAIQHIGGGGGGFHPRYLDDARLFQVGEKLYLTSVFVNKDSEIIFTLQSCGACGAGAADPGNAPFRASLSFQFPKGYLASAHLSEVQSTISQVFGMDVGAEKAAMPPSQTPLKLPATYTSSLTRTDRLQLNADHTLSLEQGGQRFEGSFTVNGSTLAISINPDIKTTATIDGNALRDGAGQVWVLQQAAVTPEANVAALSNQDIIELFKAGFDDATILAKISASKCHFDTSTDALILLKKSGVSTIVIKAMVGAGR